ncbi:MAG: hypothetical protein J6W74_03400 [Bacteroidales bacterium]|nr:hypothetical protein [Bacteroidales bacterium]
MKRIVTQILLCVLLVPTLKAQITDTLPSAEEIKAINDSILEEAYRLYLHEKVAWTLEDIFTYSQLEVKDEVAGWIPETDDGITVRGVFYNEDMTKALFESSVNIRTGEMSADDTVRDLTEKEIEDIAIHLKVIYAALDLDEEDIPGCPENCTFNIEPIKIGENLYRVYWILGTEQTDIIPFGCDFSYDCDSEGNIKDFRRYHKTYIPTQLTINGDKVSEIVHSHTEICPYMAPTDIALFLLYGYEESDLNGFRVLSTVLPYYFTFDAETYQITTESR